MSDTKKIQLVVVYVLLAAMVIWLFTDKHFVWELIIATSLIGIFLQGIEK